MTVEIRRDDGCWYVGFDRGWSWSPWLAVAIFKAVRRQYFPPAGWK